MTSKSSRQIMEEAAGWLTSMQEGQFGADEEMALTAWRSRSPQHEEAWQKAQNLMGMIDAVPGNMRKKIWGRERISRRAAIKAIASILMLAPVCKFAWDEWPGLLADYKTATGETRKFILPDGSQLYLNTNSHVNLRFDAAARRIELVDGEILVQTAKAGSAGHDRPFIVQTKFGTIRALGTRFAVRQFERAEIRVDVYEHAVAINPASAEAETRINKGQSVKFNPSQVLKPSSLHRQEPSWVQGQIISDNMKLGDLIAEMSRYRTGVLRCDPAVADYRVSGVFQLAQIDTALNIIASSLPVRIRRISPYWILVTE
ncbi:FecR domain-containing protein [Sulfitobacter sp. UBA1132]|uniref:FecR domain-containing protein n=1 Tax=Sulfitobacter sp. UBA1132 TaxID=1947582 RepID=UPI00257FEDCD|nr:FecR domain-containing protein [Sulfitobacter sp. UBA1132]